MFASAKSISAVKQETRDFVSARHENQSAIPKSKWNSTLQPKDSFLLIKAKQKYQYVILCMLKGTQNQGK
jgi:hypothetical protein